MGFPAYDALNRLFLVTGITPINALAREVSA